MSSYTPNLQFKENTTIFTNRHVTNPGYTKFKVGDFVNGNDTLIITEDSSEILILRLAERMGVSPAKIEKSILVNEGELINKDQVLLKIKSFFNLFTAEFKSPVSGKIKFFTKINSHLGIELEPNKTEIKAYLSGQITDIFYDQNDSKKVKSINIKGTGTYFQGVFGIGGEKTGHIHPLNVDNNKIIKVDDLKNESTTLKDAILVGGAGFTQQAIEFCFSNEVAGIVTGSLKSQTIKNILGYDIGVTVTGKEDIPTTIIITEAFGEYPISDRIQVLGEKHKGKLASINGATQVRAGAMRPEIFIPHDVENPSSTTDSPQLRVGSKVRLIREPFFGHIAEVVELPELPFKIESGATVRIANVKVNQTIIPVPRANLELI